MYNLALHYLQNRENAEEVTQDVFVSVYQSLEQFSGKSTLSTWIYRITINKCLDFIKAQKRKKRQAVFIALFYPGSNEPRQHSAHFDHPGVLLEQKQSLRQLFHFINQLPDNQKTALILSRIEQKSQREIADIMQISTKAVESLLQRAKNNLSKKITDNEGI